MQRTFIAAVTLWAAGTMLLGIAQAQQTPAAKTQPAPPATTQNAPAQTPPKPAETTPPVQPFKTQKDKFSYAVGINVGTSVGTNLRKQSLEFDPDLLVQGLKDALSGGTTLMTAQEAQAVVAEAQKEKKQQAGEANKKEGEAFLAANKTKEGVVTLPSGLEYKILKEGTGPKPTAGDSVSCNYRGTFINGTEFDSSYKRGQPATFPVGGVIKGWTEALQLMPVGSKWQLFIPSSLAYGEPGYPPQIGSNTTLVFEVELLSIESKGPAPVPEKK
jgi:FKBP-type peptidyl-prolyl cis-trans isomerase FklB